MERNFMEVIFLDGKAFGRISLRRVHLGMVFFLNVPSTVGMDMPVKTLKKCLCGTPWEWIVEIGISIWKGVPSEGPI
jgi:hypothetical protein